MSTPIRHDSTRAGAPGLNNAAGSLTALLIAVCQTGYNVKAVTGITVAGGVATVQCPTHAQSCGFGERVQITGASAAGLNGTHQPTLVDANNVTFPAPGVDDGSYTATDMRSAPLGWTVAHADAGNTKIILQRTVPEATSPLLRVDDTNTGVAASGFARALIVEAATGVDAYSDQAPTEAAVSGGARWQKGSNTATLKKWFVVGTSRGLYLGTQLGIVDEYVIYFFGDGIPYYAGDAFFSLLTGQASVTTTATPIWSAGTMGTYGAAPLSTVSNYVARGLLAGSPTPEVVGVAGPALNAPGNSTLQSAVAFSNIAIAPVVHVLGVNKEVRGEWPGMAVPLASLPFAPLEVVPAGPRIYLAVPINVSGQSGRYLIRLDAWGY
jgi:hypothetical protein